MNFSNLIYIFMIFKINFFCFLGHLAINSSLTLCLKVWRGREGVF